ncbi:hypothetical protein SNE40_009478 [Patella caerulea]|uniref:Uncharacterized protein n=1 Tax=Patella caerulea TaxID=87958 RepID=A0AAN8JNU9_PATCE
MCRWGCPGIDTTFMCKWCGTRYCRECMKGDYTGYMFEESRCRKCNQKNCQGQKVEYVINQIDPDDVKAKKGGKKGILNRSRSRSPGKGGSKVAKSTKTSKGSKKSEKKSSGKKKGGKKKKKKK